MAETAAGMMAFLGLVTRRKAAGRAPELLTVCQPCAEALVTAIQGLFVSVGDPLPSSVLEQSTQCGYTFQINDMAPCALHGDAYG